MWWNSRFAGVFAKKWYPRRGFWVVSCGEWHGEDGVLAVTNFRREKYATLFNFIFWIQVAYSSLRRRALAFVKIP